MFISMSKTRKESRHLRTRIREFALYTAIGLVVLAIVFAVATMKVNEDVFRKWLAVAIFTPFLFGYFIADSRSFWKKSQFWMMCGGCFAVHLLGFAVLFQYVAVFKPIWVGLISLIEMAILVFLKERLW